MEHMNPSTLSLAPWVVFLPLAGLLINLLLGARIKHTITGAIASLAAGGAFVISVLLALALSAAPEGGVYTLARWIDVGTLSVGWDFRVDTLSVTMMLAVSGVGTLIHIYAIGYMARDVEHNGDPGRYRRFFVYFNLFILAMMVLVSADNYLMLFVGWEGVGLCSYLLIGFWFEKGDRGIANARAARKAFVVNRIGDVGLLIAMFLMITQFGTLQFDEVFARAGEVAPAVVAAITLLMLLGVTGKSAQLPLYVWLPDAMAGPTPVSALIHAATMVTAGVYLIARSGALFALAPLAQDVTMWLGAITALFAGTIAVAQMDIKKVLAYSTISQLGFMVAAVGMGAFVGGMFHLVTHAFFKALLFLAAGSVIQGLERGHEAGHAHSAGHDGHGEAHDDFDPQDMRNMGGLQTRMKTTFWVYLIGALALAGIAPLAGFFSKDEIIAAASGRSLPVVIILLLASFITAFYVGRQVFMVFFGHARTQPAERATESPAVITLPLIILAALSVIGGALNLPGVYTLEHWLEHSLAENFAVPFTAWIALTATGLGLLGLVLAWGVYCRRRTDAHGADPLAKPLGFLYSGMQNKWWVDEFYAMVVVRPYNALAGWLSRSFDLGGINAVGDGLGDLFRRAGAWMSRFQNGYVRTYVLFVLIGVVGILAYLVLR